MKVFCILFAVLFAFILFLIYHIVSAKDEFKQKCNELNGSILVARDGFVCIKKDVILEVK